MNFNTTHLTEGVIVRAPDLKEVRLDILGVRVVEDACFMLDDDVTRPRLSLLVALTLRSYSSSTT